MKCNLRQRLHDAPREVTIHSIEVDVPKFRAWGDAASPRVNMAGGICATTAIPTQLSTFQRA